MRVQDGVDGGTGVVPHEGTWIEIMHVHITGGGGEQVVPHEGTWIEIGQCTHRSENG